MNVVSKSRLRKAGTLMSEVIDMLSSLFYNLSEGKLKTLIRECNIQ